MATSPPSHLAYTALVAAPHQGACAAQRPQPLGHKTLPYHRLCVNITKWPVDGRAKLADRHGFSQKAHLDYGV